MQILIQKFKILKILTFNVREGLMCGGGLEQC